MKLTLSFSVLCLLILFVNESFACSCSFLGDIGKSEQQLVNENREDAKAVFSGEVTKIKLSGKLKNGEYITAEVRFKVFKSWKGITTEEATVYTAHACCICGVPFKVGKQYLIYAYGDKDLSTNICTRTERLENAGEDVKLLGGAEKTFTEEKKKKQKRAKE